MGASQNEDDRAGHGEDADHAGESRLGRQGRFVWPPARPGQTGPTARSTNRDGPRRADRVAGAWRSASLWRAIERDWLGLTRAPFIDRAREAAWRADLPGEYCWRCGQTAGDFESSAPPGVVELEREPGDGPARGAPGPHAGCPRCRRTRVNWRRVVRLGEYRGMLRDAIKEVKFTAWRRLGDELGRLLGVQVAEAMRGAGVDPARAIVLPVPTTFRRRMARGVDHSLVIARGVREVLGAAIDRGMTRRHGPSLVSLPIGRRRAAITGTMTLRPGVDWSGRVVLVVDDVMTTGATARECCRAVLEGHERARNAPEEASLRDGAGAAGNPTVPEMWVAVIGVTPRPERRQGGRAEAGESGAESRGEGERAERGA